MPESATPHAEASDVNEVLCKEPLEWLETELAKGKDVPALVRFNGQVFRFVYIGGTYADSSVILYQATDCEHAKALANDVMPNIRCGGRNEDVADFIG